MAKRSETMGDKLRAMAVEEEAEGEGMSPSRYDKFMERVEHAPHPCKYGHINCSDRQGGPCCDEEAPQGDE